MSEGIYGINMIVYGPPKSGKSYLGDTTPAPRVVLDAEAGSRFTPSKKKMWNPVTSPPPEPDGSWETAIVPVRSFKDVTKAFEWLNSGKHPFRSVVIDSISEVQQRIIDDIAGTKQLQMQQWGDVLRLGSDVIRKFRDLVTNPVRAVDAVVFIAMAAQRPNGGSWYPFMQGRLSTTLPYYVDLVGYMTQVPQEDGTLPRRLFIGTVPGYETGERVGGKLGMYVDVPDDDMQVVSRMLEKIRSGERQPATEKAGSK
jgi:AAA domain-containing protein